MLSQISLPKNWKLVQLQDVIIKMSNGTSEKQTNIGIPVTRIETISDGTINFKRVGFIEKFPEEKITKYKINKNDILFSHINSEKHLGKSAMFEQESLLLHGMNLLLIRANEQVILPKFLNYVFNYYRSIGKFIHISKRSVNQSSINQKALNKLEIPLPPINYQKKLVKILDKITNLKNQRDFILNLFDNLLDYTFIQKFGNFDIINKKWDMVKLKQICEKITDGTHQTPKYVARDGVLFLSVQNVRPHKLIFNKIKYISLEEHKSLTKNTKPESLDILYTKVGATYGYGAVVENLEDFSIFVSLALLKLNRNVINPYYLVFLLNSSFVKNQADTRIKGIAVPDLHLEEIREFDIPVPPMTLQNEFEIKYKLIRELKNNFTNLELNLLSDSILSKAFEGSLFFSNSN